MSKTIIATVLFAIGTLINTNAQGFKFKKNRISYFSSLHNYMDGSTLFENKVFRNTSRVTWNCLNKYRANKGISLGLRYTRRIDSLRSYQISMEYFGKSYGDWTFQSLNRDDVHNRMTYYIEGLRMRKMYTKKHHSFDVLYGCNVRIGNESSVASYGAFDTHLRYKALRDLGLTIGGEYQHRIFKNINASLQLKYVRYIFRWDRGDKNDPDDTYRLGSTRNLLGLNLSIGYSF